MLRAQDLQRSLQTFQRQRERRHLPAAEVMIPPCSSLPRSPPSIPAPLTVHCFNSLGRREKPRQSPHSVPRPRGATPAPHKGRGRLRGPGGAPGREPPATGGRARAPPSRAPGRRPRAHTSSAHRGFAGARPSPAPKKNQSSRRPLLVAAVKSGQKPQPPPIRGPEFPPVPAPPAHTFKLSANERARKRGVSCEACWEL